jgi:arabinose-5-phosphate isomerase
MLVTSGCNIFFCKFFLNFFYIPAVMRQSINPRLCSADNVGTILGTTTLLLLLCVIPSFAQKKEFREQDFALRHPGGILGRRLILKVKDLMKMGDEIPLVREETPMKEALFEITSKRLGVTGVVDGEGRLVGVITDGDLRRGLEKKGDIFGLKAAELMTRGPKAIAAEMLAAEAVAVMEQFPITALFILDQQSKKPIGVIHLHDIIKAGVV